jgi:hypothetical protein
MALWLPARELSRVMSPPANALKGRGFLLLKTSTRLGTETSCSPGSARCRGQTVDELVQWMEQEASPDRF